MPPEVINLQIPKKRHLKISALYFNAEHNENNTSMEKEPSADFKFLYCSNSVPFPIT